jgi:hypothetical protein
VPASGRVDVKVVPRSDISVTRRPWLLVAVLMVVAALVDLNMLGRSTLWADEIFSLAIATGHSLEHPASQADPSRGDFVEPARPVSLDALRRLLAHENPPADFARVTRAVRLSDTSPPLYYWLLHLWTRFAGTTDGDLRAFSVGWFLLCIPIVVSLARRIAGPDAALGAGVLFITSPIAIYYSTEGRMYSLLWFCVLSTARLTLWIRDKPGSFAASAGWVLLSAAGLLVHYFFLFPWCAFVLFSALPVRRENLRRVFLRAAAVGLLVLPWYWHLPGVLGQWRVTGEWLKWTPPDFHRGEAIVRSVLQFFSNDGHYLWWDHPVAQGFLLVTFATVLGVMVWKLRSRALADHRLLAWLWFAAACAGPVVFDFVLGTYTIAVPRYSISALPAAALLGGLALSCLPRVARLGALAVIVVAWSYSLRSIHDNPSRNDQPYWKIGQLLHETGPADLIVTHSIPSGALAVARYTSGQAMIAPWVGQLGQRSVPESIETLTSGFARIFFVRVHEVGEPAPEEAWLRTHFHVEREARHGNALFLELHRPGREQTGPR